MAWDSVGTASATFIGAIAAHVSWAYLLVLALWAFGGGLMASIDTAHATVGIQSLVAFIVLSRSATALPTAGRLALLVFLGGLTETLVTGLVIWPPSLVVHRRAVAESNRDLAAMSTSLTNVSAIPAAEALARAERLLSAPAVFGRSEVSAAISLTNIGRRIRLELIALAELSEVRGAGRAHDTVATALERSRASLLEIAAATETAGQRGRRNQPLRPGPTDQTARPDLASREDRTTEPVATPATPSKPWCACTSRHSPGSCAQRVHLCPPWRYRLVAISSWQTLGLSLADHCPALDRTSSRSAPT